MLVMPGFFVKETFQIRKTPSWRHIRAKGATAKLSWGGGVMEGKAGQHAF